MWVLDHLADIESDLSRFHRIDDLHDLDGPKFFRLIWRLSAYGGVMAMRLQDQQFVAEPAPAPAPAPTPTPRPAIERRTPSRGTAAKSVPAFMAQHPGLIEKRRAVR